MKSVSAAQIGLMRVVKKMAPSTRGAIKLATDFGETLMCVRYRVDAQAKIRYTSVELLVGSAPIKPKSQKTVGVKVEWNEYSLQKVVRAAGGRWDDKSKLWRMPKRVAGILRLSDRVVR